MFEPTDTPRCFALAPGCDFSVAFLAGLRARLAGKPPEAMARVEIFVNTRRTERHLTGLFQAGPPTLMPRIHLVTELADIPEYAPRIPDAMSPLQSRLQLGRAVSLLLQNAPELAPRAAAFDLADSLAALMEEMHYEGVDPARLAELDVSVHARHWNHSLTFLDLLKDYFADTATPDAEARLRMAVEGLAVEWAARPPEHPVIVAGSTGSRGTTAMFMKIVSALPQGAVILPGFDRNLPAGVAGTLGATAASDHPQAGLARFVRALNRAFADVPDWHEAPAPDPARNRLVSLALRPAPVTDQWLTEGPALGDPGDAMRNVSLLVAPNQRREAVAIALRLRKAAEDGIRAALVSPDRQLARQVTAALQRWNILPDDSAGQPLALSPPGIFLRMLADLQTAPLTNDVFLAVLKHPLTHASGPDRNTHLLRSRALELQVLRGGPPHPDFDQIAAWAQARQNDKGAPEWVAWLAKCFAAPETGTEPGLEQLVQDHRRRAEMLANGPGLAGDMSALWQKPAGAEAARAFADLESDANVGGAMSQIEYARLFRMVLGRYEVREPFAGHPNIAIWGTLEARVQAADLVILGGLNDGVWPALPEPEPWLNRSMRAEAGLLLPERKIGLSAHDFQQAIAAREVLLTRAARDADAPTVASRWLIRLTNLLSGLGNDGALALSAMHARGQTWLDMAALIEMPAATLARAPRPSPSPPIHARPDRLSVTQIKTLIRDPYAIYAKKVLRLARLDPIRRPPDALVRGQLIHSVFEAFSRKFPDRLPGDAANSLIELAREILTEFAPWPAARRLWIARVQRIAAGFVAAERARRQSGQPVALESKGRLHLQDPQFTLTAKADRIDRAPDGSLIILDYKTGAVPVAADIANFDKQLLLEALIAEAGGFEGLAPAPVSGLVYVGLGNDLKAAVVDCSADEFAATRTGLAALLREYQSNATGYAARARLGISRFGSDYDHLSRFGEWSLGDSAVLQEVS